MEIKAELERSIPCPHCGRYDNRPIGSAAMIVRDDRVLLVRRAVLPHRGYWGLPGGHVEWDESPEDTVKREANEETGLKITNLSLFGVYGHPGDHPRQAITIVYLANARGKEEVGDDADKLQWFPLQSLPKKMAFGYRRIVRDYKQRQKGVVLR